LTDVVEDELIADSLAAQRRPGEDCERLVELALSGGAADDVTVMLADYTTRPAAATEAEADITATDG
jgi:serine/threonine protein phosphatase PrpC